jgi:hypothetical protein
MKFTRNYYPVRYKRESFFSADNDSYLQQKAAAILNKKTAAELRKESIKRKSL